MGADRDLRIGVLALQGDVAEHVAAFEAALGERSGGMPRSSPSGARTELAGLDGLAVPGGESTTISRLIEKHGMRRPLLEFDGGVFATCAGMVLAASEVDDPRVRPLGLIDMAVARNAFGRQRESFELDLPVESLEAPFHAVFIRAPIATRVGSGAAHSPPSTRAPSPSGRGGTSPSPSTPSLGTDLRLHRLFLDGL